MAAQTFEIGLVLSGTVSAGPYTAGVIDYLIETLDAWGARKEADGNNNTRTVPSHDVKIRVIAGNSGGAMTTSIIPGALFSNFQHFKRDTTANGEYLPPQEKGNRRYSSWVEDAASFLY
jgi:predicted acylesterase/phospholipase RssA